MHGPEIIARSLSSPGVRDRHGNEWSYHSRSDRHSKIACWGAVFDLLLSCPLLQQHVAQGRVAFGINHEMRDFERNRKKNLDLVLCTPLSTGIPPSSKSLSDLAPKYGVLLSTAQRDLLSKLPVLRQAPVGSVLLALEAKACMTAHQRALPRLYDELNSSHLTVHGASPHAIAAGFVLVNAATSFLSPDLNKENKGKQPVWSSHDQPKSVEIVIAKVLELPRRTRTEQSGFDAIGLVVIDCRNDESAVTLISAPPAPSAGDVISYESAIERMSNLYGARFSHL